MTKQDICDELAERSHAELADAYCSDHVVSLCQRAKAEIERLRAEIARLTDADAARNFPANTCGASRHAQEIAERMRGLDEDTRDEGNSILATVKALWECRTERAELRARVAELEAQSGAFRSLVAACNRLDAEAEEYNFDDGMGRGAALDYWHEFDQALEAARAALESKP